MKRGSPTLLQSQIGNQMREHESANLGTRLWRMEFCSFSTFEKGQIINSDQYVSQLVYLNEEIAEMALHEGKESSFTKTMHCDTDQ